MKEVLNFKCENLYIIGDLHLSIGIDNKEMDKFPSYVGFQEKITSFLEKLKDDDILILCGDTCWAKRHHEAFPTLDFLSSFKGKKIIFRGNHDYWFEKLKELDSKYENLFFIKNQNITINDKAFVLHKGYYLGDSTLEEDIKILERETVRVKNSIDFFISQGYKGSDIYVGLHYPPILSHDLERDIKLPIYEEVINNGVHSCFYGHIHGDFGFKAQVNVKLFETEFRCVSCDIINFTPIKIF